MMKIVLLKLSSVFRIALKCACLQPSIWLWIHIVLQTSMNIITHTSICLHT